MTWGVAISVVIPAHNEQDVIARCLEALTPVSGLEPLEVVVVCNGCDDRTAEVARTFDVQVVETSIASKTAALNLGDARVAGFPRFYVDADVVVSADAVRRIAAVLERGQPSPHRRPWTWTRAAQPGLCERITGSGRDCRTYAKE
jgi:glycosyltransferase involved in cell wall biosynthesis